MDILSTFGFDDPDRSAGIACHEVWTVITNDSPAGRLVFQGEVRRFAVFVKRLHIRGCIEKFRERLLERIVAGNEVEEGLGRLERGAPASDLRPRFGQLDALDDAGVSAGAARGIGGIKGFDQLGKFGQRFASSMAGGIANAASRSLINGDSFGDNLMAGLPDILGQTVGGLIADAYASSPSAAAEQIKDDLARALAADGSLSKEDRAQLRTFKREATKLIREARRLESTDPIAASRLQNEVVQQALSYYPASEAGAARQLLSSAGPASSAYSSSLGSGEIVVTGTLPEQPYGAAFGLLDRPSVQAGRLKARAEGELNAWIESTPGARTAMTVINWGLTIAGGPTRFVAGAAYGAVYDEAVEATTNKFASSGFGRATAQQGGSGLPWLAGIALGTIKLGFSGLMRGRGDRAPSFSQTQLDAARSWGVHPKWINPDGGIRWPGNDGFAPGVTIRELQPGAVFDRFGGTGGHFASPPGTPFPQRSLPNSSLDGPLNTYEVVRPLPGVVTGKAAPWFDQPGGGGQYKLPMSIEYLLENGFIRPR